MSMTILITFIALLIRLANLTTIALWHDEAFSVLLARLPVKELIYRTGLDVHPPFYYFLLKIWGQIFGQSLFALRAMSVLFGVLTILTTYGLLRAIFPQLKKKYLIFLMLALAFAPFQIQYSQEMRMYSLYAFLSTAAIYYFYVKNWKKYIIAATLGLYSHSFFILIILTLTFYNFLNRKFRKDIGKTLVPVLFFLPWMPILINQFIKSKESWLFSVDWQLIKSALGNLFTAYEGTPGHLWRYTFYLSIIIVYFMYLGLKNRKLKSEIFVLPAVLPLLVILTYSVLKRPIYVNRYLIFISAFEVLAVFSGIISIKKSSLRNTVAILWLILIISFNFYITSFRKKTDFKSKFIEINKIAEKEDFVFARTPIGFLESVYYFKYPDKTFVYNPLNIHIPNYIGVNIIFPNVSRDSIPVYPSRVFMVNDDASYEIVQNR